MVLVPAIVAGRLIMSSPDQPTGPDGDEAMTREEAAEIVSQDDALQKASGSDDEPDAGTDEDARS